MSDSNKNVVKSALKNMVPTSASDEETFDFPALPYVCQKRLAEILDPKTLKTFSKINTTTKNLSKRCHIVKHAAVEIDEELNTKCKYTLSCFCEENEFCRGINESDLSSLKKKIDVHSLIHIITYKNFITSARYLQSLPFTFDSCKRIILNVRSIKLDDLKMVMHSCLKGLGFVGGIESDCTMKEFMVFIKSLTQLDSFQFYLYHVFCSLSFNTNDLASEGAALLSQKVITKFETNRVFTGFEKLT